MTRRQRTHVVPETRGPAYAGGENRTEQGSEDRAQLFCLFCSEIVPLMLDLLFLVLGYSAVSVADNL